MDDDEFNTKGVELLAMASEKALAIFAALDKADLPRTGHTAMGLIAAAVAGCKLLGLGKGEFLLTCELMFDNLVPHTEKEP